MILTPYQESLLSRIASLKVDTALALVEFNREQLAREQAFRQTVDTPLHDAMYKAFAAGVPKRQIGAAYGSKDATTVNKILSKYTASTAATDRFEVAYDADTGTYTVTVDMMNTWTSPADAGRVLRDVSVQFTLEDGFPTFLGDDPWEDERAPLARQIEMHAKSNHPLNTKIATKI